jgi:hypothetical protein
VRVFENRAYGGRNRRLENVHSENSHGCYYSPNIIRVKQMNKDTIVWDCCKNGEKGSVYMVLMGERVENGSLGRRRLG